MKLIRVTNPTMGVLVFFSAVLAVSVIILLGDRSYYLRQHQVQAAADRSLLAELAARTTLHAPAADACLQVTYSPGRAAGLFHGLATTLQWDHENRADHELESHLAFSVDQYTTLQRDPARPPRSCLRMIRSDLGSDPPGTEGQGLLQVSLTDNSGGIGISNQPGTPGVADGGSPLTDQPFAPSQHEQGDEQLLMILSRILRGHLCDDLAATRTRCYDCVLLVYQETGLDTYGIDLQALGHDLGVLRMKLTVDRTLATGELKVIRTKSTTLQCMANLYVVPPRPHGVLLTPDDPGFRLIHYEPSRPPRKSFRVHFDRLLTGTAWPAPGSSPQRARPESGSRP